MGNNAYGRQCLQCFLRCAQPFIYVELLAFFTGESRLITSKVHPNYAKQFEFILRRIVSSLSRSSSKHHIVTVCVTVDDLPSSASCSISHSVHVLHPLCPSPSLIPPWQRNITFLTSEGSPKIEVKYARLFSWPSQLSLSLPYRGGYTLQ